MSSEPKFTVGILIISELFGVVPFQPVQELMSKKISRYKSEYVLYSCHKMYGAVIVAPPYVHVPVK
jgi:hypothetical protein